MLSLDSSVLIDLINGHPTVRQRYNEIIYRRARAKICALAAHEVIYGALISRRPAHQEKAVRDVFAENELVDWTVDDADSAAALRADLRGRGQTIGSIDSCIAGQALARGWTVVTSNVQEFSRVAGLKVIDWTAPVA